MIQHIHILGICGTFMGSLAQLAKASGFKVTGCDTGVYPPMSDQLEAAGIELVEGFDADQLSLKPDLYVIGNVVSRGNPLLEAILDRNLDYISGPQWLSEYLLKDKWVLAVAGTHGKTTTSSMLAWILEYAGFSPGFLIGGVPENFGVSARLGESDFFVIEADEYDTAFCDKRSKFVHYRPKTLVINNLEYDHADIFPDLAAIQTQFHHLVRLVPSNGAVITPKNEAAIDEVIAKGCWSELQSSGASGSGADWCFKYTNESDNNVVIEFRSKNQGELKWHLSGLHNIQNAMHAIAAARHIGIAPSLALDALTEFNSVKRRMECVAEIGDIRVYDDFAHHPTAISTTLDGLRRRIGGKPIVAVIEPRSNTMRMGTHNAALKESAAIADQVYWLQPNNMEAPLEDFVSREDGSSLVFTDCEAIIDSVINALPEAAQIVVMSNGAFANMPRRIAAEIEKKER